MSPSARDLPPDVRAHILSRVREQVGEAEYKQLISQVGEDGLLDLVLSQLGPSNSPTPNRSPRRALPAWVPWAVLIAVYVGLIYWLVPIGKDNWQWWHYILMAPAMIWFIWFNGLGEMIGLVHESPVVGCLVGVCVLIVLAVVFFVC
jgi:hypothetical protein